MSRVEVRLPGSIRFPATTSDPLTVEGSTVGEALSAVASNSELIRRRLFDSDGALRQFVSVYLNDRDIRGLERERTPLRDGDVVSVVAAAAGGSSPPSGPPKLVAIAASSPAPLTAEELHRYSRHLLLPEVGVAGQKRLRDSKVLLVGAGGLGSPAGLYLAAAGVGEIGIVEFDAVDRSNLQRQVLYSTEDVGQPKLERAAARLVGLNPDIRVRSHEGPLRADNALEILRGYDVVVDGTDNFPTRYLVNDACVLLGKPAVYGSVYRFEGQASVFDATRGPCYRCLFPEPPPPGFSPSCAEGGVLGVLPGLIGEIQATETLKLLLGIGDPLIGRLLLFDALEMRFRELKVAKSESCVLCGPRATQTTLIDYPAFCGTPGPGEAEESPEVPSISAKELSAALRSTDPPLVLDVREPGEWDLVHLPEATLIPQGELPERLTELSRAREIVVYCRSGRRSASATRLLLDVGFTHVRHLRGGLDAWRATVDPSIPTY